MVPLQGTKLHPQPIAIEGLATCVQQRGLVPLARYPIGKLIPACSKVSRPHVAPDPAPAPEGIFHAVTMPPLPAPPRGSWGPFLRSPVGMHLDSDRSLIPGHAIPGYPGIGLSRDA